MNEIFKQMEEVSDKKGVFDFITKGHNKKIIKILQNLHDKGISKYGQPPDHYQVSEYLQNISGPGQTADGAKEEKR